MKVAFKVGVLCLVAGLVACGQKTAEPAKEASKDASAAAAPVAAVPDVGRLETETVQSQGTGVSQGEAIGDALRLAIMEVNGAVLDMNSAQLNFTTNIAVGKNELDLRSSTFAEMVTQRSGGAVTGFKVLELTEPSKPGGLYRIKISASISKFSAPADTKKIKVAVAPLRYDSSTFVVGSTSVPAEKVAQEIRQKVIDGLVNTGRFAVVDREFQSEVQGELDMISSGQAPSAEIAKLGQAVSADLLWVGRISSLAYNRHARKLQTSDRELVSYDGGWALSQRVLNVATRQIMVSDSAQGTAPSIAPTTLGATVNGDELLQKMESDMADSVVSTIVARTFPITVLSRDGETVVLSQGGKAVKEGMRYRLAKIGAEMKDPQTGQSLGRMESPCCEVVIDKVQPNLSYGHLENVKINIDGIAPGGLQLREQVKSAPKAESRVAEGESGQQGESQKSLKTVSAQGKPHRAESLAQSRPAQEAATQDNKW
ncbi:CsgG/HfaB family protein [Cupriavidus sp. IDO]|uniref:CsgG/HfaB family protein n=1 Tax=Cupriavidus sp. IDO TaxID=1539142 RepID=UPI0006916A28|nr:CsgG/HfaB family protein [Cupriavidus sp. IDO]KWR90885.1 hypothetical protein RM96_07115 [Cupriavidus sp. IDO]